MIALLIVLRELSRKKIENCTCVVNIAVAVYCRFGACLAYAKNLALLARERLSTNAYKPKLQNRQLSNSKNAHAIEKV